MVSYRQLSVVINHCITEFDDFMRKEEQWHIEKREGEPNERSINSSTV